MGVDKGIEVEGAAVDDPGIGPTPRARGRELEPGVRDGLGDGDSMNPCMSDAAGLGDVRSEDDPELDPETNCVGESAPCPVPLSSCAEACGEPFGSF